jgi:hypothetical protein
MNVTLIRLGVTSLTERLGNNGISTTCLENTVNMTPESRNSEVSVDVYCYATTR